MIEDLDFQQIDELLDRMASAHRRGERPQLPPEVEANPKLARRIQKLLNAMIEMEGLATPFPQLKQKSRLHVSHLDRVGSYIIVREIGRGGMGVVYEAEQPSLRRRVALKVLPDFAKDDPMAIERFQREARAAARLHHTNIVPIFEVGRDGDRRFFAMQLISGCGLDRIIRMRRRRSFESSSESLRATDPMTAVGPLPPDPPPVSRSRHKTRIVPDVADDSIGFDDAMADDLDQVEQAAPDWAKSGGIEYIRAIARAGARAAAAIDHAHSRGVVHRDIKPSNLLVDESGVVWVTDFGLAKTDDEDLTRSNAILGTVRYMAPERFRGKGDHRSDVYSLGVTLYEAAALRPAFTEFDHLELIRAINEVEPPKLRSLVPTIPRDFETVILKAIDKDPVRRYQSAGELQRDLERFVNDEPVHARRTSASARLARWCRKNPVVAGLTAAVALLLIGFAGYFVDSANRLRRELDRVESLKAGETKARLIATERLRDAQIARAKAIRQSPSVGRSHESLAAIADAAEIRPDEGLRNEAIAGLAHFDLQKAAGPFNLFESDPGNVVAAAFDPDIAHYAVFQKQGIAIRRIQDGRVLHRLPHAIEERFWHADCAFSPSGKLLAVSYRLFLNDIAHVAVWEMESGKLAFSIRDAEIQWIAGDRLAMSHREAGALSIRDSAGVEIFRSKWRLPKDHAATISSDGRKVALWSRLARDVTINRLHDGRELASFANDADVTAVGWSPDDRLLVVGQRNFECLVWNVLERRRQSTLIGHLAGPIRMAFHPTGAIVATSALEEATNFWNPQDGRLLLSLPSFLDRWSPDGLRLATRDAAAAQLWKSAGAPVERTLNLEPLTVNFGGPRAERIFVDFSSDERLLVCTQSAGVRIFSCGDFREILSLPCAPASSAIFDRDGSYLYVFGPNNPHRWPIAESSRDDANRFSFGPPEPLERPLGGMLDRIAMAADRREIAVPIIDTSDVAVVDLAKPWSRSFFGPVDRPRSVALSPDGKWLAATGWRTNRVTVWNLRTRQLQAVVLCNPDRQHQTASLTFSPDSRFLLTQGTDLVFWDTADWQRAVDKPIIATRHFDVPPAFSSAANLLAVAISPDEIGLFDASSIRKLASLTPSNPVNQHSLVFSSSGRYLASSTEDHKVRIWNLEELRRRLRSMRLDWEDSPPAATPDRRVPSNDNATPTDPPSGPTSLLARSQSEAEAALRFAPRDAADFPDAPPRTPDFGGASMPDLESVSPALSASVSPEAGKAIGEAYGFGILDPKFRARWRLISAPFRMLDPAGVNADWHFEIGESFRRLGVDRWAVDSYRRAIEIDPKHARAHFALAMRYMELQQFESAATEFSATLEGRPGWRDALLQRGNIHMRQLRWRLAAEDFDAVCSVNPSDCWMRIRRDTAWIFTGRAADAARDLGEMATTFWYDVDFAALRIRALARAGNEQELAEVVANAESFGMSPGVTQNAIARALIAGPDSACHPRLALEIIERGMKLRPQDNDLLNTYACVLFRLDRMDEAIAAVELRKQRSNSHFTGYDAAVLALCYAKKGQLDVARSMIDYAKRYRNDYMQRFSPMMIEELNLLLSEAEHSLAASKAAALPIETKTP